MSKILCIKYLVFKKKNALKKHSFSPQNFGSLVGFNLFFLNFLLSLAPAIVLRAVTGKQSQVNEISLHISVHADSLAF